MHSLCAKIVPALAGRAEENHSSGSAFLSSVVVAEELWKKVYPHRAPGNKKRKKNNRESACSACAASKVFADSRFK